MLSALLLSHVIVTSPPIQDSALTKNFIPVGQKAPNFVVTDDNGKKFDLYKELKTSKPKATIINFWFVH